MARATTVDGIGRGLLALGLCLWAALAQGGCGDAGGRTPDAGAGPAWTLGSRDADAGARAPTATVTLWEDGRARALPVAALSPRSHLRLDLGEDWTPVLFTDGVGEDGTLLPNAYRKIYLRLARGAFGDDRHGRRAQQDGALEVFGILPTPARLRARLDAVDVGACDDAFDATTISEGGAVRYRPGGAATRFLERLETYRSEAEAVRVAHAAIELEALVPSASPPGDRRRLRRFERATREHHLVLAVQDRLWCAGFLGAEGDGAVAGVLDRPTREALRAFERRHGIAQGGRLAGETLRALAASPEEGARRAVLRVLTERAVHALGAIEDGSSGETYVDGAGVRRPIPNLRRTLRERIEAALGLSTFEGARAFLRALPTRPTHHVYIAAPELPDYYTGGPLRLHLEYDRGDVWYDFPFDGEGKRVPQPRRRRPELRVRLRHAGQDLVLARFPTTIGGWQRERVEDADLWKYKQSPPGPRVWERIVAAPVWLPPQSTPALELLTRRDGRLAADRDLVGPSHHSAYGLAVAYHRAYRRGEDGALELLRDEGIRSHGTANISSVGRGFSHGCHRLHNPTALRLMSFVLSHVPHVRTGQEQLGYLRQIEHRERSYSLRVDQGGYGFSLTQPVPVTVLEGTIVGARKTPIRSALPAWDAELAAYVMPDGTEVRIVDGEPVPLSQPADELPFEHYLLPPAPEASAAAEAAASEAGPRAAVITSA